MRANYVAVLNPCFEAREQWSLRRRAKPTSDLSGPRLNNDADYMSFYSIKIEENVRRLKIEEKVCRLTKKLIIHQPSILRYSTVQKQYSPLTKQY